MPAFALLLIAFGAYLMYASITNQAPVKTLTAIINNPGQARAILGNKAFPISTGASLGAVSPGGADRGNSRGSTRGEAVVAFARSKVGQPYRFGGSSDGGWDCSGLVMRAIDNAYGIKLAHSATAQLLDPRGRTVKRDELQPGDVVFPNLPPFAGDHVQIYSGSGKIIEAARPGTNVREVPMWGFYTAKRFG